MYIYKQEYKNIPMYICMYIYKQEYKKTERLQLPYGWSVEYLYFGFMKDRQLTVQPSSENTYINTW